MSTIRCFIGTSNPEVELGFEIWLDDNKLINFPHLKQGFEFKYELPSATEDREHELRFILKNKTRKHTELDSAGNIIKDATITISKLTFDDVELGQIVTDQAVYTHDFNGSRELSTHKFYGEMGCNGTVSLKFSTPIYLWLLEQI